MERHPRRPRTRLDLTALGLLGVLLGALAVRLWGIGHGLPYSYNVDEEGHFVPVAIGFFGHGLNPRYFLNPPGYTELLYVVYAVWFGGREAVARAYVEHPSEVFAIARVTCALLGTAGVAFTYLLGRRLFDRPVGLLAAALAAVAFLPVFYSHLALNDVPAMAVATLALACAAAILRTPPSSPGRARSGALRPLGPLLLGGLAVGLAAGTKYTAGIVLVPLLTAVALRARERRAPLGAALGALALAGGAALVGFLIANPHALLSFAEFREGVATQRRLTSGEELAKLGLTQDNGVLYYLWTFTWGLGWVPALAALAGAALVIVRARPIALVLLPAVVVYLLYMGSQERYFGRWLLPLFPIATVLAAYAAVTLARAVAARVPRLAAPAAALAAVALLAQSAVHAIHNDRVLAREDTRGLARRWLVEHVPRGARVMLEPVVPARWSEDERRSDPATPDGRRWELWNVTRADVDDFARPLPGRRTRHVKVDKYVRTLRPALIDRYEQRGYCWVVIGSSQRDRALVEPDVVPHAIAYYDALARRGEEVARFSPYDPGADPPAFNFDWAFNYYPLAYRRPGPEIVIYRLSGGRCASTGAYPLRRHRDRRSRDRRGSAVADRLARSADRGSVEALP